MTWSAVPSGVRDPARLIGLRQSLSDRGLDERGLVRLFGTATADEALSDILRYSIGALEAPLRDRPSDLLVRLFVSQQSVARSLLERHIGRVLLEELERAELVSCTDDRISAQVAINPTGGLLILSQPLFRFGRSGVEFLSCSVMPPHLSTFITLDFVRNDLTRHRDRRDLIDVGTGSGVIALLCASMGLHVFAMDLDPACQAFLKANAKLNGLAVGAPDAALRVVRASERRDLPLVVFNSPAGPFVDDSGGWHMGESLGDCAASALEVASSADLPEVDLIVFGIDTLPGSVAEVAHAACKGWRLRDLVVHRLKDRRLSFVPNDALPARSGRGRDGLLLASSMLEREELATLLSESGTKALTPTVLTTSAVRIE